MADRTSNLTLGITKLNYFNQVHTYYSVQPPPPIPPLCWGRGVESPIKFSKREGGLGRTSVFREGLLGKRGEVFQGVDGKIQVLRGGPGGAERSQKTNIKPIYRGDCLKRGAWTVCRFKRAVGIGWYHNAHYAYTQLIYLSHYLMRIQISELEHSFCIHTMYLYFFKFILSKLLIVTEFLISLWWFFFTNNLENINVIF